MKIALVQDWFVVNGGAEKVVKEIVTIYPEIEIFSLVDFLSEPDRNYILNGKKSTTSFIQNLPFARTHYRTYLPFFPRAIESLDFSGFDVIISSSYAVAKGIRKTKDQIHICYCHSPVRYAWDLEKEYLSRLSWLSKLISKQILKYIRKWDLSTTERVDLFIANSNNVSERIKRIYNRDSIVIYPPVDTISFSPETQKSDYYFTSLRVVPYKKLDLIIETFNLLPNRKLIVAGEGPELQKIKKTAKSNIEFIGFVSKKELISLMQKAKAFVLAAEEDFGITSVEAQSCCTPVIAFKKGGYLETVVDGKTGLFFQEQTTESLSEAILRLDSVRNNFTKSDFIANADRFSIEKFRIKFKNCVNEYLAGKSK
ncbi:MAG: glycosyltransferase [Bacteroidetes bacterium]|nr:glycosyltransferase [Bacteroidota bacterium]